MIDNNFNITNLRMTLRAMPKLERIRQFLDKIDARVETFATSQREPDFLFGVLSGHYWHGTIASDCQVYIVPSIQLLLVRQATKWTVVPLSEEWSDALDATATSEAERR